MTGMAVDGSDDTLASSLPTLSGMAVEMAEVVAGRYQIIRWLGGGGMGRVYEVKDTELGERVALKVLRGGLSAEAIERFRREVRLTRRIQHRNVARMFDIGEHKGDKFLTMELVEGGALTRDLGGPLPWSRVQSLAVQICAGLAAAHRAGVVHRDLKPDNVLIENGTDRAVITDFGIARSGDDASVTQFGMVIGTPRYMAPEQLAGTEIDARADLFSLGVMLFELACGQRPWAGENPIALAVAQATQPMRELEPAHVPSAFVDIVKRCLEIDRALRPATAEAVHDAIAACTYTPTEATRAPRLTRPPAASPTPSPTMQTVSDDTTIAVLPFTCATADDYLADGLVEDLIDTLSTTPSLKVRPAGVLRDRAATDPRALGMELEVDHVVSGSVRRNATGLRISARLISVADGFQIWAHRVDCAENQILEISEQVGRGVAQALSTRAGAQTSAIDQEAVDYYLRARAEIRRFWGEHVENAAALLEKAAVIAPTSGPILSALAFASVQTWVRSGRFDHLARAEVALQRAIASGNAEAHLAASSLKFNRGDLLGGAAELGIALSRAPMAAFAHETAGRLLIEIDAVGEGLRHFDTALGLDASRAQIINADLARIDALRGDWVSADRRLAALLADPDPPVMQFGAVIEARLAMWQDDLPRIMSAVSRLPARVRGQGFDLLGIFRKWSETGAFDEASWNAHATRTADHAQPHRSQLVTLQRLCESAAFMKQPAATEHSLRTAVDFGLIDVLWLDQCPLFAPFRTLPWMIELRDEVHMRARSLLAAFRAAGG
ncbi:hypothetical protein BH11MYX3_BH11MYX3_17880 [soil metagenome]